MKKRTILNAFLALSLVFFSLSTTSCDPFAESDPYVYITETGSKYHKSDCRYLDESRIKISKSEAQAKGYEACSVCKP